MAKRDRDSWTEDFSLVLRPDIIRRYRRNPDYEVFLGSKWSPLPLLILIAVIAGALGGLLVSGGLWSRWWQVPVALAALVVFVTASRKITRAAFASPIGFLAGWCLFFGMLTGAFAMWGAQLESAAWAYGIAGGLVFFLLGITGGLIEPPNSKHMEDWFFTSAIMAPISACLAAWLYRNVLPRPEGLDQAALTGAIAALPFLAVTMTLHLLTWKPERGMLKLATLLLHNDASVGEALPLLDRAIAATPEDLRLFERRALAHALAGDMAGAEQDWARLREVEPHTNAPEIGRGWLALRRNDSNAAARAFEEAMPSRKRDSWALVGLGIARLRVGDFAGARDTLKRIRGKDHDALSLTYLAEAYLGTDDAPSALSAAVDAIEEADSIHGRSWIVRAEAQRALGRIDAAAEDYNRALWADDEPWIVDRAMAGLEAIDRPVSEDEPEW